MKTVKRVQQLYQERNKLLEESGLGDFAHTDEEIEQLVAEAIEKDISKSIEKMVKDSGL
tara:strand:+ start:206 stop:382 length:177 start_codon:yes stop_codon:yes gene_type:complete